MKATFDIKKDKKRVRYISEVIRINGETVIVHAPSGVRGKHRVVLMS